MSIFDDADAMYRPRERENGAWGVWDNAAQSFESDKVYTRNEATFTAMRMNDWNSQAENATWD